MTMAEFRDRFDSGDPIRCERYDDQVLVLRWLSDIGYKLSAMSQDRLNQLITNEVYTCPGFVECSEEVQNYCIESPFVIGHGIPFDAVLELMEGSVVYEFSGDIEDLFA